jgi:transglutaminase-like putative cysteine protease
MSSALIPLHWRQLPRDARDTLFLLAVIGWTVLPHLSHLPPWCVALTAAVLLWRARLALNGGALPGRWWLVATLALAVGLTLWTERTLLGKDAGVTLLVVLMGLKTLELRARRDALVVFFLGFFLVLTHFLYSQALPVAMSMLVSVWGLLTALVLAHMPVGRPSLLRAGALAARTAVLGAPLMVALFLLFPRVGPLWGLPNDAAGRTGLSGSLRLGGVADLANDDSIAMRVRFFGAVPPQRDLYFRGPVLAAFDGIEWTRGVPNVPPAPRTPGRLDLRGEPVRYEATLEPSRLPLLPLLEMTPDRPDAAPRIEGWNATQRADLQWQLDRPLSDRVRVQAQAWPGYQAGPLAPESGLRELVALPPGTNLRTRQWAAELRTRQELAAADARTLAAAVLSEIRGGGFTYTLEPGPYGRDGVDEFWLERKLGFCEHFAAAFVVIMRAMDVPARIVTGYQGTDAGPVDGYWIVRQSNAHAWAEYWQAGEGWVRADPTAAVAPERVQRGTSLPPVRGFVSGAIGNAMGPALAAQLRAFWEGLDNRWNQWVLNYSRGRQFDLMRQLGIGSPSWQDLATLLIGLLCSVSLAGAGWALWDRQRQDPWQRLQRRMQDRLAALGVPVAPHQGPRARAEQVRRCLGAAGEELASELEALDRQRYADEPPQRRMTRRELRAWQARLDAGASALSGRAPIIAGWSAGAEPIVHDSAAR